MFPIAVWKVRLGLRGASRVFGTSMEPLIPSGSRLVLEPVERELLEPGDVVVARVGDATMVHLVTEVDRANRRVEIAGTTGPANGWTPFERVYGICTRIGATPVPGAGAKTRRRRRR